MHTIDRPREDREWRDWALSELKAAMAQAGQGSLLHVLSWPDPRLGLGLVLMDATGGPTGSLKDWYVRDLFYDAVVRDRLARDMLAVDATSGSTGIAEAYWAERLGLRFIAVMPESTTSAKQELIRQQGGECRLVPGLGTITEEAERLAVRENGYYLGQFPNAAVTPDWHRWHGPNSLASIADREMSRLRHPVPTSTFMPAGTGRALTLFALDARAKQRPTQICVADSYDSALCRAWRSGAWRTGDRSATGSPSVAEGIARPQLEPGIDFGLMDDVVGVTDEQLLVTLGFLEERTGKRFGGSTGVVVHGAVRELREMRNRGQQGSVLVLCGDDGDRYSDTLYSGNWREQQRCDTRGASQELHHLIANLDDGDPTGR